MMENQNKHLLLSLALGLCALSTPAAYGQAVTTETDCQNRVDDDGDGLTDCADADCYNTELCKSSGGLENTDEKCSDFIDNDGDGSVDCEDMDCSAQSIAVCQGSWKGPINGTGVIQQTQAPTRRGPDLPALGEGMTVEDLMGVGDDKDGERNDLVCSDGLDNDGDGRVDCADFGCRFDPSVSVCENTSSLRFSMIANVMTEYDFSADKDVETPWDTRFNRLQLRTFGPLPYIQNSFFYLGMRADRTPRFTFAFVSIPVWGEHFLNVNSGGGGLSNGQVISSHKNMLLDVPYFLYNAFEQGNGAAAELSGPLLFGGRVGYRVFIAGGSGRSDGNIGGRYYRGEYRNYTWGAGGQLSFDIAGHFGRWDTRMLYTPTSLAATFFLGSRYDERDAERYSASNANLLLRYSRLIINLEGYLKREFNFGAWQWSYNAQVGILVIPKYLMIAGDVGQFYATEFDELPANNTGLSRPNDEFQWRLAAHVYVWRTVGIVSLLYTDAREENQEEGEADEHDRTLRLQFGYRF